MFVSDDNAPSMVIVPDDGYAVVNFAKYKTGLKLPNDEAKYKRRCARAALKAFVLLCGGAKGALVEGRIALGVNARKRSCQQDIKEAVSFSGGGLIHLLLNARMTILSRREGTE